MTFAGDEDSGGCTGISAAWCPHCGDCTCDRESGRLDDRDCPLHSVASPHPNVRATIDPLAVLWAANYEMARRPEEKS
jgi:hypothetical protein